ncbi:MAG: hypothetical protein QXU18_11420, partial [Thermoplasmatales archaeon]
FIDNIDSLTERRMKAMSQRANSARNANRYTNIQDAIRSIKDNRFRGSSKELFFVPSILLFQLGNEILRLLSRGCGVSLSPGEFH